jgi:hypothetical protein
MSAAWLQSAHAGAMLSFNLQPSRWLHASRWPLFLPAGWPAPAAGDAARHRHLSGLILERLGDAATPVTDPGRREWPLALAPAALLRSLTLHVALVLVQRRVRHAITREDARACAAVLDDDLLAFTRERAPMLGSGHDSFDDQPLATLLPRLEDIGSGSLWLACADAPKPLQQRLRLRTVDTPWQARGEPGAALALATRVLDHLDPRWLSSFPRKR